ncbi:hypothetical protein P3X46_004593 [Hevea brasiliensis]|uniref:WRKY domain-containing protein n=2 Tax=Hevea brasiliensis TaxID=3981 RepID=A0ABQ9MY48_HEVBR|nr:hypothetical protein P3X46_004593 [Hevea brasiliensis]
MNRPSWTKESSFLTDDGYSWRKYGEKVILNCLYPRNYFRCIHKCDQGCQATKQVQRLATVSPKYRITYFGHHTCRNILKDEEIITTYPGPREEGGILLSFERPRIERNTTDSDMLLSFKLPKPKIILPKIESNTRDSDLLPFKGPKVGPIQRFPLNIIDSDPCASYIATANSKISGNNNQHFLGSNQESAEEDSVGPIGNDPYVELNMGKDLRSFVSPETSMSSDYGTAVYSSTSKSSSMNSGAGPIDFDAGFYFHI